MSDTIALWLLESEFTHKGKTMTGYQWVKYLKISNVTWARRYYKYYKSGVNPDMLFMNKREMEEYINKERSRAGYASHAKRNDTWSTFKNDEVQEKNTHPDQIAGMYWLIAEIINLQKENLERGFSKKEPTDQDLLDYQGAYRFLTDAGGDLSYYIDVCDNIDKDAAKAELQAFASKFPSRHPCYTARENRNAEHIEVKKKQRNVKQKEKRREKRQGLWA